MHIIYIIIIITFILTLWQSCVLSTVALINEYDDDDDAPTFNTQLVPESQNGKTSANDPETIKVAELYFRSLI